MSETMTLEKASVIVGEHCAADDASWEAWTILRNHLMNEVVGGYFGNMPNEVHLSRPVSVSDDAYEARELARLALHRSAPIRESIDHLDKHAEANHAKAYQAVLAALESDSAWRGDLPIVTAKQYGSVCNELTHAYMYITERSYGNAQSLIDSSLKQVREWQRLAPQPVAEGGV